MSTQLDQFRAVVNSQHQGDAYVDIARPLLSELFACYDAVNAAKSPMDTSLGGTAADTQVDNAVTGESAAIATDTIDTNI